MLFYAGAPADELFLIREGRVRFASRRSARGVERTVRRFRRRVTSSERGRLLPGRPSHCVSAEALEPVTALVVDSDTFRALVTQASGCRAKRRHAAARWALCVAPRPSLSGRSMLPDPTLRVLDTAASGRA